MRVHGGARAVTAKGLPHIDLRIGADREAKERIARLAHGLLKPGMSVFFSGGSTALATAWEARHEPPIIATSLMVDIMIVLSMGGQTDLTLCGGQFDKHSRASFGFEAMEIISRRVFDIAFMGQAALMCSVDYLGRQTGIFSSRKWCAARQENSSCWRAIRRCKDRTSFRSCQHRALIWLSRISHHPVRFMQRWKEQVEIIY